MRKLLVLFVLIAGIVGFWPTTGISSASEVGCVGSIDPSTLTATSNGHCVLVNYRYKDGVEPGVENLDESIPQTYVGQDGGDKSLLSTPAVDCAGQMDLVDESATIANPTLDSPSFYDDQGVLIDYVNYGTQACESGPPRTTTTIGSHRYPTTTTTAPAVVTPLSVEVLAAEAIPASPKFTG